jgi:outer membrane lipoprotein SlyB
MNKLFTFGGATVGSYVGWIVGLRIGVGTAIVLSSVAALAGVVAGWKLARRFR